MNPLRALLLVPVVALAGPSQKDLDNRALVIYTDVLREAEPEFFYAPGNYEALFIAMRAGWNQEHPDLTWAQYLAREAELRIATLTSKMEQARNRSTWETLRDKRSIWAKGCLQLRHLSR